jgi:hypothetical protein
MGEDRSRHVLVHRGAVVEPVDRGVGEHLERDARPPAAQGFLCENRGKVAAGELADSDQSARIRLVSAFDRWEGPIRSGLARMQARGELSERTDTAVLATTLLAAIQGGMLLSQVRRSSTAYRQAVSAVIDHIESYLVR